MIRTTRASRVGAALAATALVLTACGGAEDEPTADPTNEETSEGAEPTGDGCPSGAIASRLER